MQDGAAMIRRLAFAGVLLGLLCADGVAQEWRARRSGTPGNFDFYVLALSWSPTFCESEAGQRNRQQCGINSRNEFVVHGLWPQYDRGFPENCSAFNRPIPRAAMDKAAAIFPDERLARYEWNKHGTCSGSGPSEYFDDVAHARSKVVIPSQFARPGSDVETSPQEVERAFTAANKGLRADMMSVQCKRQMLSEIRICFSKDLREFVSCPEVNRSGCRTRNIVAPASR
jgi:ribonuclease T2